MCTASVKHNFSALKRMKVSLRNAMIQQHLSQCMLLHIHQDKKDTLNLQAIAKVFVQKMKEEMDILDI